MNTANVLFKAITANAGTAMGTCDQHEDAPKFLPTAIRQHPNVNAQLPAHAGETPKVASPHSRGWSAAAA